MCAFFGRCADRSLRASRKLASYAVHKDRRSVREADCALYVLAECKFRQEVPKMRVKITLACTECKQRNYNTKKNKKNDPDRLEMNKYCKFCKKHTLHKETK